MAAVFLAQVLDRDGGSEFFLADRRRRQSSDWTGCVVAGTDSQCCSSDRPDHSPIVNNKPLWRALRSSQRKVAKPQRRDKRVKREASIIRSARNEPSTKPPACPRKRMSAPATMPAAAARRQAPRPGNRHSTAAAAGSSPTRHRLSAPKAIARDKTAQDQTERPTGQHQD